MLDNGTEEHKNRVPVVAAIAAAIMLSAVIGGIIVYAFINRGDVERNCKAALRVRDAVVVSYVDALGITRNTKPNARMSQKDKDQAISFYLRNIKQLKAVHCAGR